MESKQVHPSLNEFGQSPQDKWAGDVLWTHVVNNKTRFDPLGDGGPVWTTNCIKTAWEKNMKKWQERQRTGFARGELSGGVR